MSSTWALYSTTRMLYILIFVTINQHDLSRIRRNIFILSAVRKINIIKNIFVRIARRYRWCASIVNNKFARQILFFFFLCSSLDTIYYTLTHTHTHSTLYIAVYVYIFVSRRLRTPRLL